MLLLRTSGRPLGRTAGLLCACLLLLVGASAPQHAEAQYLKLEGIDGESMDAGHEGEIDILSYSQGVSIPIDMSTGLPAGERRYQPIRIRKRVDKSSPLLQQAISNATAIPSADLLYDRRDPTGAPAPELRIGMTDVRVIDVAHFIDRDDPQGPVYVEEVTFVFNRINWVHEPSGTQHEDVWAGSGPSTFEREITPVSRAFELSEVFPNPADGPVAAFVTVSETQAVTAAVYDVAGREVMTMFDGTIPSSIRMRLDATDALPAGVYFLVVRGEVFSAVRKFTVIP